jgi:predicted RNA binding protein YcfA (HicA-like mRNA interferase family)
MPKKIRELKSLLKKAGFIYRSAKGSHTRWYHPLLPSDPITISGKDGDDAKLYRGFRSYEVHLKPPPRTPLNPPAAGGRKG